MNAISLACSSASSRNLDPRPVLTARTQHLVVGLDALEHSVHFVRVEGLVASPVARARSHVWINTSPRKNVAIASSTE